MSLLLLLLLACAGAHVDADGDGYTADLDCDDQDPEVFPGAVEVCDGVDNDCDGAIDEPDAHDAAAWYVDDDGDGYGDPDRVVKSCGDLVGFSLDPTDCDDDDASVHPGAAEIPGDGIDNDCDPATPDAE